MQHYPNYHRAARLAYRTLIHLKIDKLPIDILSICSRCKETKVMSFSQAEQEFGMPEGYYLENGPSDSAFTIRRETDSKKQYFMLYNNDRFYNSVARLRFSLAHELGHILMQHETGHVFSEMEANCFAQHLLCPAPLVEEMKLEGESGIGQLSLFFGVSRSVASIVVKDLKRLLQDVDLDMHQGIRDTFRLKLEADKAMNLYGNVFSRMVAKLG